ncbi:MAG: 3-phosphoshikimate 1-carboxyvinyltransferase [Chloroflexota bacterium]|nr:3-phosphoshikimate 1-carboxyvinyltransferase [Chloroflexota bacterium]
MRLVEPFVARRVGAAKRLHGELRLPSDKSIAHRALLFTAMASGRADVVLRSPGMDVRATAAAVGQLGAFTETRHEPGGTVRFGMAGGGSATEASLPGRGAEMLDCLNSGTTARLLMGALSARDGREATLTGDGSLSRRPMERVAVPLREMGADVESTGGRLPVHVRGRRPLRAMAHRLPVASAQVLGAITLAAMAAEGRTTIETPGPTRDHTERMLAWLGVPITRDGNVTTVDGPTGMAARSISVPGDLSSAAAWLVAGSVHPDAALRLVDVSLNPSRMAIVDVLRDMGADIEVEEGAGSEGPEPAGDLLVRSAPAGLRAVSLSGAGIAALIDELPLLAIAMAAADGVSEVRDAAELRVKESDRIGRVVRNLRAIGIEADELPDGWRIQGTRAAGGLGGAPRRVRPTEPVEIQTGGDHRIAIAFALASAVGLAPEVEIDEPGCVDVSYPGFWAHLATLTSGEAA